MASDIAIQAEEILRTRARLNELYVTHTERPLAEIEKEEAKGDACAYLEGAPPYDPSPPPPPTTEEELAAEDEASAAGPCAACGKDPRVPRFKVDAPEAPSWRTS